MKMRVVAPRELIGTRRLSRAIENGLTGAAKGVKTDMDTTTQTFKRRPTFTIEEGEGKRTVATDDEVYGFLDEGTKPHVITAHGPGPLVFGIGGHAKTTPRVIGSKPGGKGATIVRARQVHHPGNAPRDFTEVISKKWDDRLPDILQRAIDAAL